MHIEALLAVAKMVCSIVSWWLLESLECWIYRQSSMLQL